MQHTCKENAAAPPLAQRRRHAEPPRGRHNPLARARRQRRSGADLVVLDSAHPDLAGRTGDTIANALVFSGATGPVRDVMIGGK